MNKYYKYTQEEIARAHNTDLVTFLETHGEKIEIRGNYRYWNHNGEVISIKNNLWYNHYTLIGGEAIEFVREFYNVSFFKAVGILLGESEKKIESRVKPIKDKDPFILPERNDNNRRAYAYLVKTRGIDGSIVSTFMDANLIYEQAKYHNVVFVGCDRDGKPRHANMRGTGSNSQFKMTMPKSKPEFSFHWTGIDDEIYLFEAPIDLLSYISLHQIDWQNHSYAAACSISDRVLMQCLKDNPGITNIHICFDNDEAGIKASSRIYSKLLNEGYVADIFVSFRKDWNEDLQASCKMSR